MSIATFHIPRRGIVKRLLFPSVFKAFCVLAICPYVLGKQSHGSAQSWQAFNPSVASELSSKTITHVQKTQTGELFVTTSSEIYSFREDSFVNIDIDVDLSERFSTVKPLAFLSLANESTLLLTQSDGWFSRSKDGSQFNRRGVGEESNGLTPVLSFSSSRSKKNSIFITETEVGLISAERSRIFRKEFRDTSLSSKPAGVFATNASTYLLLKDGSIFEVTIEDEGISLSFVASCGNNVRGFETATYTESNYLLLSSKNRPLRILEVTKSSCEKVTVVPQWFRDLKKYRIRDVILLSDLVTLVVVAENGLHVVNTSSNSVDWIRKNASNLRSDDFTSVAEVGNGIVWVGSFLGLVELRDSDIIEVSNFGGINYPEVIAIDGTPSLGTFVATPSQIFRVYLADDGMNIVPYLSLSDELAVSSIYVTLEGVWVGVTSGDLHFFKHSSGIDRGPLCTIKSSVTSSTPVSSINSLTDKSDTLVVSWFGGSIQTVANCEANEVEESGRYSNFLEGQLKLLRSGYEGTIYSVGFNGVFLIKGLNNNPEDIFSITKSEILTRFLAWDGVRAGAFDYFTSKTGEILYIDTDNTLPTRDIETYVVASLPSEVFSVELDKEGRIWVATSEGVWLIDKSGPTLEYRSRSEAPIYLDYGVSFASSDGDLYFGGTGGFLVIKRPDLHPSKEISSVSVLDLRIDGKNMSRFLPTSLGFGRLEIKRTLEVIVGNTYSHKSGNGLIQHTLQGYDTDWINTGPRGTAVYSNLPPGDYTFRARGANASGMWSDNEISLPIRVLTPFWLTYWAFALYLAFIAVALLFAKRLNDSRVLKADRLLRAQEQAVAFSRLEDDFQNQHEATQSVIRRERNSAADLLKAIRLSLATELSDNHKEASSAPLADILDILEIIQHDATRSSWQLQISLIHVTELLVNLVLVKKLPKIDIVVVNKSNEDQVPLSDASFIVVIVAEILVFLREAFMASEPKLAVCSVAIVGPFESKERGSKASYKIEVESDVGWLEKEESPVPMTITNQLISNFGGSIKENTLRSNQFEVTVDLR
ncbi:MAG: triple tyrosine motif-containing protein [Pseudomonadota bacterium]